MGKLPLGLAHGERMWHFVDAKDQVLGRISTAIVPLLMGKHKPIYTPHKDCGDYVVVINARHVKLSGNKNTDKIYRWHTQYPGGLKERSAKWFREHRPEDMIHKAVHGMMAKNRSKKYKAFRLKVFADDVHPHLSQLGKSPKPLFDPPVVEEQLQPEFINIAEFPGSLEDFNKIKTYGSSWKVDHITGKKLQYGVYHEEEHVEDEKYPTEWDD